MKLIVEKLKISHEKFFDPDFGPNDSDPFGAKSLYGLAPPAPAGSKYPTPESLKWDRPMYDDSKFVHEVEVEETSSDNEDDEFADFDDFGPTASDCVDEVKHII